MGNVFDALIAVDSVPSSKYQMDERGAGELVLTKFRGLFTQILSGPPITVLELLMVIFLVMVLLQPKSLVVVSVTGKVPAAS